MKKVMLVGNGTYYHVGAFFKKALEGMGLCHFLVDESKYFDGMESSLLHKVLYRLLGRRPLTYWSFNRELLRASREFRPDIVLIVKGTFVNPEVLDQIKAERNPLMINYATDDPFNPRSSSRDIVSGIPFYDLYVTTKRAIISDLHKAGSENVIFVHFGYEPTAHYPEVPKGADEARNWESDVVFIGGCDDDRIPFFVPLTHLTDVSLRLYGGYWDRNPELQRYWRGFALGRDYRLAMSCTKIAPCLVRRRNRDGHVMRTFEVPACGAFLLAERTEEHLELFEEDKEMVCFDCPEELVDKVKYYLIHDKERQRIAEAGYRKVTGCRHTYKDRLNEILKALDINVKSSVHKGAVVL